MQAWETTLLLPANRNSFNSGITLTKNNFMRHQLNILILILSILTGFYACKNDVSDVAIIISPDSLALYAEINDLLPFDIKVKSSSPLRSFKITQQTAKTGIVTLIDSIIEGNNCDFQYVYIVPANIREQEVKLSFVAETFSGSTAIVKYIFIDSLGSPLHESSAHVMYSGQNQLNNAFSVAERLIVSLEQDSLLADIYDYRSGSVPDLQLSGEWRSLTGLRFARFNDFNYAEATTQTLQNSFENASKKTIINNLETNDVILIGHIDKAVGVIKIIAIYDDEGYGNDRYVFNLKYY